MEKFTFKKDKFRASRGNYSRFANLYCSHCGEYVLLYQKDGPGPLKRLYWDRILAPKELAGLKTSSNLVCKKCNRLIGIPYVYEEENRKVYLLLSYAVIKKVGQGIYPPKELKIPVSRLE